MQGTADVHHHVARPLFPHPDGLFEHAAAFDTALDMFDAHPSPRDLAIARFLLQRQRLPAQLLRRLEDVHALQRERLKAQGWQQMTPRWQRIRRGVSQAFVVDASRMGRTQKEDAQRGVDQEEVLQHRPLFLAALARCNIKRDKLSYARRAPNKDLDCSTAGCTAVVGDFPCLGDVPQRPLCLTYRYDHTATLACASTCFAMGVSSRWKNLIIFPARIGYASSHGTPANIRSTYDRVSGQSHSMCGTSVANIKWSTPMWWRISIAVRSTCCTLSTMLSRMYSLGIRFGGVKPSRRLFQLKCLSYQ